MRRESFPRFSGRNLILGETAGMRPWGKSKMDLQKIDNDRHVLLAGPTASGKSSLALDIARRQGGVIVNADASQVYNCWRVVTARPSAEEESQCPHHLYGHLDFDALYSAGHWLREVEALLATGERLIIVGGTGLYFSALTEGLAEIPLTAPEVRAKGDLLSLESLIQDLDAATAAQIDLNNRARVQRAWEVLHQTGRPLIEWQAETPPPLLSLADCTPLVMQSPKEWLEPRIRRRFDQMLEQGALEEVEAMRDRYDPALPSCKAIGVPELMDYATGQATLDEARERAAISTRRYAKRQRSWFRSRMQNWHWIERD